MVPSSRRHAIQSLRRSSTIRSAWSAMAAHQLVENQVGGPGRIGNFGAAEPPDLPGAAIARRKALAVGRDPAVDRGVVRHVRIAADVDQAPAAHQLVEDSIGGFRRVPGMAGNAPCDLARLPVTRGKTLAVLPDPVGHRVAMRHRVFQANILQRPARAQFAQDMFGDFGGVEGSACVHAGMPPACRPSMATSVSSRRRVGDEPVRGVMGLRASPAQFLERLFVMSRLLTWDIRG
jgi:hypothetical protein